VVVHHVGAIALAQEALGDRHADAVGEALAERPGGDLDAGRHVDAVALGVAGRQRAPLAEALDLVHRERVAREVQHAVEQHRAVAGTQQETIAVGPVRVRRVVIQNLRVEHVSRGRHAHGQARVPGVSLLHRIHGQRPDGVDCQLVDVARAHAA
jgi:hypothetical protein